MLLDLCRPSLSVKEDAEMSPVNSLANVVLLNGELHLLSCFCVCLFVFFFEDGQRVGLILELTN